MTAEFSKIQARLTSHGYTTEVVATSADPDSAKTLGHEASRASSLVLACGGDGTLHGVVQGLAHTDAALGIIPLGTANALARNLKLPLDPLAAVERLLTYEVRKIPLGGIDSAEGSRYFAVMAGCGPDGTLVHELSQPGSSGLKARFGRTAYYAHAARLFWTRRWPSFQVEYRDRSTHQWASENAVAVMASRIPDLGGWFSGLTSASRLEEPWLRVQILRAPAQLALPAWVLSGRLGSPNPWLRTVEVDEIRCTPLSSRPVYAQADAEPLGPLPMTLRIVPNALSLLMPG